MRDVVSDYDELRAFMFSQQKRLIAMERRICALERQAYALKTVKHEAPGESSSERMEAAAPRARTSEVQRHLGAD